MHNIFYSGIGKRYKCNKENEHDKTSKEGTKRNPTTGKVAIQNQNQWQKGINSTNGNAKREEGGIWWNMVEYGVRWWKMVG